MRCTLPIVLAILFTSLAFAEGDSTCYGTTANGRLENAVKLPASGSNFSAYSTVGRIAGRTYVHSKVHDVVLDAYAAAADEMPGTVFVYGETGKKNGGEFDPHKTHRNGLSVDFMVPVTNAKGESIPLPTNIFNKWGYSLEFDATGELGDLSIDFVAIAEHLYQLHQAATRHDGDLWRVILAPELQPFLKSSDRWTYLERHIEFSTKRSWVRHDEHYHVDFDFACAVEDDNGQR